MIRPPPRSTLFPSTTLSRSRIPPLEVPRSQARFYENSKTGAQIDLEQLPIPKHWPLDGGRYAGTADARSEEHTSELQSRLHLVCRLLLEKKKIRIPR